MLIDKTTMKKIHGIQLDMMIELKRVMDILNIRYYFVHGSLLGAITLKDFIIEDDDIDIALFREDYNRLVEFGNDYLNEKYFIQSSHNDDFPLSFAKMRNNETTFIQPILDNYNCNKGIYIDIFPIDYTSTNNALRIKEKLLSFRINSRLSYTGPFSFKRSLIKVLSYVLYPSYKSAIAKRESMYTKRPISDRVSITNGKLTEQNIPKEWFSEGVTKVFSGIDVTCPLMYDKYLSAIYGDSYLNHNPAEDRINQDGLIEISARVLDFDKSYKSYNE